VEDVLLIRIVVVNVMIFCKELGVSSHSFEEKKCEIADFGVLLCEIFCSTMPQKNWTKRWHEF
jgi:hypothetical protein